MFTFLAFFMYGNIEPASRDSLIINLKNENDHIFILKHKAKSVL